VVRWEDLSQLENKRKSKLETRKSVWQFVEKLAQLSFRGVLSDEEFRIACIFRAGFLAALGMTWAENVFQQTAASCEFRFSSFALPLIREQPKLETGNSKIGPRLASFDFRVSRCP